MSRRQNDFYPTSYGHRPHGPTHWTRSQHAQQLPTGEVLASRASHATHPYPHQHQHQHQHRIPPPGHQDFSHERFDLIPRTAPPPDQQQQSAYTYNHYPSGSHGERSTQDWEPSQTQYTKAGRLSYDAYPPAEEELVVRDPAQHHMPPSGHYPVPLTYDQTNMQPSTMQPRYEQAQPSGQALGQPDMYMSGRSPTDLSNPQQAPSSSKTVSVTNLLGPDRSHIAGQMKFSLSVRQQPKAARACGSGERDRRNIDPPPIVELHIESPGITREEIKRYLRYEGYVMNCSIYDSTGAKDASHMPSEYRYQRRLTGSLVSTPFHGWDDVGKEGCFFPFSDLSVRTLGRYRLKFTLVMLDLNNLTKRAHYLTLGETMSGPFEAFTAKDFPGIRESSLLVRALREQGCIIAIKKGNDKRKPKHRRMGGDEEPIEDDDFDDFD